MCETCQGHFFLQNNVDGTFRHFLLQSAFQILLDGFPGSQTPHAAVSLNEADTPVTDANQEDALRLLDFLEGTIGPELHQRADLLVGLECYSLLSGNSGGDPVVVVDHLGAQRDVADQLHGIERVRGLLETGAECDLGFLKTEGGLCLPTGNVCGVCFIIDLPEAALVIIFGLAEAADSLAVRNGDVQRGIHLAGFGSDHRYQRVQTVQVQCVRMENGGQDLLYITVIGNAEGGAVHRGNERLRGLLDVFDKFFQHGVVSSSGKFNEFERRGCFLFGSGNSELAGDLRDHLHNIFLVSHIQHGGHSVCGRQSGFDRIADADILSAVGRILQEKDFTHITLMDIAREAKTDPNVVLRQFGSLEQVFDCYIRTIDYWMHDLFGNKALKRGERSALERMFARMTDFLYNSPEMQRLLVWEITDVNDTTCRAAANRETYYREAYEAYERQFARGGEKTPFRQIASLLIAGTYYLVLHRHTSTFGDMDYDTPDGPVRLKKVLHEILDMLYERLERPQRVSEAIRRLKERGVDEQVIRECLKDL